MSSSGASFFRKGESIATRMWNTRKPEVPLTTREHTTSEDSRHETLPLNTPCQGLKLDEEYRVTIGPKPRSRALQLSTYATLFSSCIDRIRTSTDSVSFGCCFVCVCCVFALGTIATFILCLCVAIGYREPYTELKDVTLREFNLSRTNELASSLAVVFEAGNPSKIAGFTTRFLHTEVTASYHNASLGTSLVPNFSLGRRSRRNVTAEVGARNRLVDEGSAAEMRKGSGVLGVRIDVNAYTKQKYLARTLSRWFNLTCSVDLAVPSGRLLRKSCALASTEPNFVGTLCAIVVCMRI